MQRARKGRRPEVRPEAVSRTVSWRRSCPPRVQVSQPGVSGAQVRHRDTTVLSDPGGNDRTMAGRGLALYAEEDGAARRAAVGLEERRGIEALQALRSVGGNVG